MVRRTEENSQVQSCCCSPKRLATKMQRDFPDNSQWFTWNGSRKEKQGNHTTHKELIGSPSIWCSDQLKTPKGYQKIPKGILLQHPPHLLGLHQYWHNCLGLDQESHQAADSLGQKNPGFDKMRHSAAPQQAYWCCHTDWDWEGSTWMDSRTSTLGSKWQQMCSLGEIPTHFQ